MKKKILFVCLGNICRSPMAEFYMKDLLEKRGETGFEIASAGTSGEEEGNPVHRGTERVLRAAGIPCGVRRARRLTAVDGAYYDLIVGMDARNVADILRIIGKDKADKVARLLDFTGEKRDVADPWWTGDFNAAFRDVSAGCEALYRKIKSENERA